MKVLFIGGTGFISTAVSRLAVGRDIELYHLNRGLRMAEMPGVKSLVADVHRPDKAPEGHRFSSDQLVHDLRQRGIDAYHLSGVDTIVTYLADHVQPGDVVLIMSNGSFGNIHEKLLKNLQCDA